MREAVGNADLECSELLIEILRQAHFLQGVKPFKNPLNVVGRKVEIGHNITSFQR
jgi:hypothetical protein